MGPKSFEAESEFIPAYPKGDTFCSSVKWEYYLLWRNVGGLCEVTHMNQLA